MSRLTKDQINRHRAAFERWQSPEEMLRRYDEIRSQMTGEEFSTSPVFNSFSTRGPPQRSGACAPLKKYVLYQRRNAGLISSCAGMGRLSDGKSLRPMFLDAAAGKSTDMTHWCPAI